MELKQLLNEKIQFVDKNLKKYLPQELEYPSIIFQAMHYSVFAGGKRLRPIMLLSAFQSMGGKIEKAIPFACAIEMIHTYSLIHDDLPAMDNDDYRRGILTSHKKFGEDIAILAGDALLHHSFEVMANACCEYNELNCVKAMQAIAHGAGVYGMLSGQVVDVISEGKKIEKETLDFIHKNKTAAMIEGALKVGAILADATEKQVEQFRLAGEKIGIAFQIQDDILDVTSTLEELGKPIHSDEKNEKTTYVTLFGIEKSKQIVEQLSSEAIAILESLLPPNDFLIDLTKYLIKRSY